MSGPILDMPSQKRLRDLFRYVDGHLVNRVARGRTPADWSTSEIELDFWGYIRVGIGGARFKLHRLIWQWHNKTPLGQLEIDHKDGNRVNCKYENLRLATRVQNSVNSTKRKGCSSKYIGVHYCKRTRRWQATIKPHDGLRSYLGRYATEEQAYAARVAAEKKYHKEFAAHKRATNFKER